MKSQSVLQGITQRKVYFPSEGLRLTGNLFLPEGFDEQKKYDGILVTGSWINVKEQMAGLYAQKLAQRGFVTLAFDFRYFGESEGEPRNYESPQSKITDWKNAISYMASLPFINKGHIMGLGVCASGMYVSATASQDDRLKRIALVAPWLHNAAIVREVYGGEEGVRSRIEAGQKAKALYAEKKETVAVPASSETDPSAAMYGPFTYYLDKSRGLIPEWPNKFAVMSWPEWLEFDGVRIAGKLTTPVLVVHSEEAAIPQGAKQFYEQLKSPEKNFIWTTGNQFDFYDQEPNISFVVEKLVDWFSKN